jgi:enolase
MANPCTIKKILAREIYDSRGVPTVEVDVITEGGWGRNAAPFGAPGSRGEYEASAYGTVGIEGAVSVILNELAPRLVGMDAAELARCDDVIREIDGTSNFSRIGGNTSSALSIAIARAAADALNIPLFRFIASDSAQLRLPFPLGNVIGGGAHSTGPAPDMQEHLVLPVSARSFQEAVKLNIMVHEETGRMLAVRDTVFCGGMDDERAWTANLNDYEALEVLSEACSIVTHNTGAELRMGLDVAADRIWNAEKEQYMYTREGISRTTDEQIDYMESLIRTFNLFYVEDGFNSNDYGAFAELNKRIGASCFICGDDLLATNIQRTQEGLRQGSVNSMIIKVNQIGTLTDARATTDYAQSQGIRTIISHRSGETDDDTISHIGVGWNCTMIKTGVLGGERLTKLNELIRIEEQMGKTATMTSLKP